MAKIELLGVYLISNDTKWKIISDEIFNLLPWITLKVMSRGHVIGVIESQKGAMKNMHGLRHSFLLNPSKILKKNPLAPEVLLSS